LDNIADVYARILLSQDSKSAAIGLDEQGVSRLLVCHRSVDSHSVLRALAGRKLQQCRDRGRRQHGFRTDEAQARHIKKHTTELTPRREEAAAHAFHENFTINPTGKILFL